MDKLQRTGRWKNRYDEMKCPIGPPKQQKRRMKRRRRICSIKCKVEYGKQSRSKYWTKRRNIQRKNKRRKQCLKKCDNKKQRNRLYIRRRGEEGRRRHQ